jgi:hypothetical protein
MADEEGKSVVRRRPFRVGAFWGVLALLLAALPNTAAGEPPPWLPRYDVLVDLDVAGHTARVRLWATWTNPHPAPTRQLVFNAHSRYVVPAKDIGLLAKTLEMLRLSPAEGLPGKEPPCEIHRVLLGEGELPFRYEGDTKTALVVDLPGEVGQGQSVTVTLDLTMHLPQKHGRWGQWGGVTFLSNWLPVFAFYGDFIPNPHSDSPPPPPGWQPTPFVPWHQPFFNEAGHFRARVTLPIDQKLACTGRVVAARVLEDGRQTVEIHAPAVRDFALLCSARYQVFEGSVTVPRPAELPAAGRAPLAKPAVAPPVVAVEHRASGEDKQPDADLPPPRPLQPGSPAPPPATPVIEERQVRIQVFAFPEHEHYAREMVRIVQEALAAYSKWFGPYPYPEFRIAEAFFGWNGNECSNLVMIDERIFAMPHLAGGFVDSLVSHEVCHQWWYNVVGTNGYCETWMDEGLATYFSHRLLNEKVGKNNPLMKYPDGFGWLPNIRREDYRNYGLYGTFGRGENTSVIQEMNKFGHVVTLFSMCYDKGSRIVGMIEDRLGEAAFIDFMRLIFRRYQYRILRVQDFRRELEVYTGRSWKGFFDDWLYGAGLCDWSVQKVHVEWAPHCRLKWAKGVPDTTVRATITLRQKAEYNEQTVLGIALPGQEGYPIRIPIWPQMGSYDVDSPPAHVEVSGGSEGLNPAEGRPAGHVTVTVFVTLPAEPTQVAVDPDQIVVDRNPRNNYWKTPVRWRVAPVYTFLEETDLTNAYDRWNVIVGPWLYGQAYIDPWYTRSTMIGVRAGTYRTQGFMGGVYGAYRTDFRDVVAGVDGLWDHWPYSHFQVGFMAEQRLFEFYPGDADARRAVLYGRYIFKYNSSLYMPPMQYLDVYTAYQDNFLPFLQNVEPQGARYNHTATAGLHYRVNYLTPYWNPQAGYWLDLVYEGGLIGLSPETQDQQVRPSGHVSEMGLNKVWGQFSYVQGLPDLSGAVDGVPVLGELAPALRWLGQTRLAMRVFGATSEPARGEIFAIGGSQLFRAFSLAEWQGSTAWVGSVEWRVPFATGLSWDFCDHVMGIRGIWGALFYDVADVYISGHAVGPVAHGLGAGLRLDVTWFSLVERTLLRFDVAKAVNLSTGTQFWFGVGVPF